MQGSRAVRHLTRREWDALAPRYEDASYRQCGAYAEAAAADVGARAEFVGLYRGAELIGLAAVRVKAIPVLSLGIAYVNHGPLVRGGGDASPALFGECLERLKEDYVGRRRLTLRVAPPQGGGLQNALQAGLLEEHGLLPTDGQHRLETFILDLDPPLEAIRARFDRKWHASLVRAERSGLTVTRSRDPADFARFEAIYEGLVERKGFFARQGAAFFSKVLRQAQADDRLVAHLAWHRGEVVAGNLCSFVGDTALMILAAADGTGRDLLASFLLQWAVIQHAKASGNRFYDLGGVDQAANPDVYRFKKRLNGRHVTAPGTYDLAPGRARQLALDLIEDAWSALRARRRGLAALPPRPAASAP